MSRIASSLPTRITIFCSPRHRRIQKLPCEKTRGVQEHGQDHHRIFAALTFVDGDGVGVVKLVQGGEIVSGELILKKNGNLLVFEVDLLDIPDIPVEDPPAGHGPFAVFLFPGKLEGGEKSAVAFPFDIVIVADLHDLGPLL